MRGFGAQLFGSIDVTPAGPKRPRKIFQAPEPAVSKAGKGVWKGAARGFGAAGKVGVSSAFFRFWARSYESERNPPGRSIRDSPSSRMRQARQGRQSK